MLTFFIVAAVMLLSFAKDSPPIAKDERGVIAFYWTAMGAALLVIALYCFSGIWSHVNQLWRIALDWRGFIG